MEKKVYESVDTYIAQFPANVQEILQKIRTTISKTAPLATEKISYQMPTFHLYENLVHFAAYANHVGFYPSSSGVSHFENELKEYKTSKGAIQFPLDQTIPYDLIARIVTFRVHEATERKKTKNKK